MATGLIGEKAGSPPRAPGRRPRPASRPAPAQRPAGHPGPVQRPAVRPGPGQPPTARPGPAQPPAARPAPARPPGAGTQGAGTQPASRAQSRPRTPFVLLLVGLLGGGLICLLLINTTLAQGSFQITAMQQKNTALTQQVQALQQLTTQQESPASIAARARQLGMQPVARLRFLDLKKGRIYNQPASLPGVTAVPGYTP